VPGVHGTFCRRARTAGRLAPPNFRTRPSRLSWLRGCEARRPQSRPLWPAVLCLGERPRAVKARATNPAPVVVPPPPSPHGQGDAAKRVARTSDSEARGFSCSGGFSPPRWRREVADTTPPAREIRFPDWASGVEVRNPIIIPPRVVHRMCIVQAVRQACAVEYDGNCIPLRQFKRKNQNELQRVTDWETGRPRPAAQKFYLTVILI
jgi:hypothetical protein